jgi:dTDP-4-dehydrorhamnose reductase
MQTGLILGAQGMLGSEIKTFLSEKGYRVLAPPREKLDITNSKNLADFFHKYEPSWVINCAAKHNLASCEEDFNLAMNINSTSVGSLAEIAYSSSSYLIHISTDYVFNGKKGKPYWESDKPDPVNRYGVSKLEGEKLALKLNGNACIVRVAALFGSGISRDKGTVSFVDRMRSKLAAGETIKVTAEQIVSPTNTSNVARQLFRLIKEKPSGLFHGVNEGFASWYDLTVFIAKQMGLTTNKVLKLENDSGNLDGIERPKNSSLENARLKEMNLNEMQGWEYSVSDYLRK